MRNIFAALAFIAFASPALAGANEAHAVYSCLNRVAAQSMAGGKAFNANDISRRFVASCDHEMTVYSHKVGLNQALDELASEMRLIEADSKGDWTP